MVHGKKVVKYVTELRGAVAPPLSLSLSVTHTRTRTCTRARTGVGRGGGGGGTIPPPPHSPTGRGGGRGRGWGGGGGGGGVTGEAPTPHIRTGGGRGGQKNAADVLSTILMERPGVFTVSASCTVSPSSLGTLGTLFSNK